MVQPRPLAEQGSKLKQCATQKLPRSLGRGASKYRSHSDSHDDGGGDDDDDDDDDEIVTRITVVIRAGSTGNSNNKEQFHNSKQEQR